MNTDSKHSKQSTELNEIRKSLDNAKAVALKDGNHEQAAFFEDFATKDAEWVEYQNRKLLRKVDMHLLPMLIVMYLFNFLDRSNLAQAREGTLEADLGMKGTDFNLATSIFFIGYLLMQLPSNMLITRVRPSLYLAAVTTLWGVVSTCNAATHNFTGEKLDLDGVFVIC
jgi:sugar phosphate permease